MDRILCHRPAAWTALVLLIVIQLGGCGGETRKPDKSIEFFLNAEDKVIFAQIIRDFATDEALSIDDFGEELPTVGPGSIFFVLDRGKEIEIYIVNVNKPNKFHIGIFNQSGSADWEPLWDRLMGRLHKAWPDKFPNPQSSSARPGHGEFRAMVA